MSTSHLTKYSLWCALPFLRSVDTGAAAVPNKPVHRDTKFFLDALMDDDKFENALVVRINITQRLRHACIHIHTYAHTETHAFIASIQNGDPVLKPTNLRPVAEDSKTNDAPTKVSVLL